MTRPLFKCESAALDQRSDEFIEKALHLGKPAVRVEAARSEPFLQFGEPPG